MQMNQPDITTNVTAKEIKVQGTQAEHRIQIFERDISVQEYQARKAAGEFENWAPESGAALKTLGWLKKLLKKVGWPTATEWEIYQSRDGSGYQIFNTK